MPAKIGRTDRSTPIPGRVWYAGAWRTPEEADRRREWQREKRRASSGGVDRRKGPRKTDEEKEATRLARNERRAASLRQRRADDPEWAERDRVRQRGRPSRYIPTGRPRGRPPATPEERAERERRAKERKHAEREQRRAARRFTERIAGEKIRNRRAPAAVRAAWSRSQPGSILRRKYPTMAALDASARRGEWDGWTA